MNCWNQHPFYYSLIENIEDNSSNSMHKLSQILDKKETKMPDKLEFDENIQISKQKGDKCIQITVNQFLKQINICKKKESKVELWRSLHQQKVQVQKKDIIRVENTQIEIIDLYDIQEHNEKIKPGKITKFEKEHCRICFGNISSINDPLLNLCKCNGSIALMHLECYREWMLQKVLILKKNKITYFQLNNVRCELCKSDMPFTVYHNGRTFSILNYKKDYESKKSIDTWETNHEIQYNESDIFETTNDSFPFFNSDQEEKEVNFGKCLVIKTSKIDENGDSLIKISVIKMQEGSQFYLGDNPNSSTILKTILSRKFIQGRILMQNGKIYVKGEHQNFAVSVKIKQNKENYFKSYPGILLDLNEDKKLFLHSKPFLFSCFTSFDQYCLIVRNKK